MEAGAWLPTYVLQYPNRGATKKSGTKDSDDVRRLSVGQQCIILASKSSNITFMHFERSLA